MKFSALKIGDWYVAENDDYGKNCVIECLEVFKDYANFKIVKGNDTYKKDGILNYGEKFISCDLFKPYIYKNGEVERINHPTHYNQGIEAIEYIESHKMDFNEGNVIKYLTRAKYKGAYLDDLKKARWYLDRLIKIGESND